MSSARETSGGGRAASAPGPEHLATLQPCHLERNKMVRKQTRNHSSITQTLFQPKCSLLSFSQGTRRVHHQPVHALGTGVFPPNQLRPQGSAHLRERPCMDTWTICRQRWGTNFRERTSSGEWPCPSSLCQGKMQGRTTQRFLRSGRKGLGTTPAPPNSSPKFVDLVMSCKV